MSDDLMDRRHVLRGAGVVAGGVAVAGLAAAAPAGASEADAAASQSEESGSWWLTRTDDGTGATVVSVTTFAPGGGVINNDISPTGPLSSGTWREDGRDVVSVLWAGLPGAPPSTGGAPAVPGFTIRTDSRARVRPNGRSSGRYTYTVYRPGSFTDVAFTGSGTFTGRRIEPRR